MGLIDRFKRGGSGFLHNVDGNIVDGQFTDSPEFGNAGASNNNEFRALWYKLTVRQDGGDADQVTHLFAGNADSFVISEDGHSITPVQAGKIDLFGAFTLFFESWVRNGGVDIPEDVLQNGGPMDFSALVGARVRFEQVKDEAAMKRSSKGYRKSGGKINELGQKKGKDGKFYDQRTPTIAQVYSVGNGVVSTAATTPATPAARKPGRPAKVTTPPPVVDIKDFAAETLLNILNANKGKIAKTGINLQVTRMLVGDERKDAVRKYLYDDSNLEVLADEGMIEYDAAAQTITLA